MSSNLEGYKNATKPFKGMNAQFLYSASSKTDLVEYHECTSPKKRTGVILFQNISERDDLIKEYENIWSNSP